MAAFAGEVSNIAFERLAVTATGAHCVGEREVLAEPLELAWLAPYQAPPFGWMVADFEEAPVYRNIASIDVQHDDLTGRNAHDRVPGATAQQVGAPLTDARPAPGLEFGGSDGSIWIGHACKYKRGRLRGS